MKFETSRIIQFILFGLALASSLFPRPLDVRILNGFIVLFLIFYWRDLKRLVFETLQARYFFGLFALFYSIFSYNHSFTDTQNAVNDDGLRTFVPAFLFFSIFFTTLDEKCRKSFIAFFYFVVAAISSISLFQFFGLLNTTKLSISESFLYAPIYRSTAFFPHSTANTIWLLSVNLVLLFIPIANRWLLLVHSAVSFLAVFALSTTQGRAGFVICLSAAILKLVFELSATKVQQFNFRLFLKPVLITASILVVIFSIILLSPRGSGNRFSDFLNAKTKHNQRLQENYLGKEILLKYPFGAGPIKIFEIGPKSRKEDPFLKDSAWIFDKWHGIHNGYLHYGSIWGWPGLFCVITCLFMPLFLKRKQKLSFVLTACLGLYFFTDNIFYREISSIFAFSFLAISYFSTTKEKLLDKTNWLTNKRILSTFLFIVFALLSIFLVPLRTLQIQNTDVMSLAIDNPSSSLFQVFFNKNLIKELNSNQYASLFFKSDANHEIRLQSKDVSHTIYLNASQLKNSHYGFWITTDPKNNYFFLFYEQDSHENPIQTEAKGFTAYPIDPFALNIENFSLDKNGNRLKQSVYPEHLSEIIRDEFMRDSTLRCFEPSRFDESFGVYENPCLLPSNRNYRMGAIKQVFGW